MAGPLDGITVIDLSTVIAGPYASQMLGDFGARVIKIEPPGGDIMRAPGPARSPGMGAAFLNCNRNKESRILDLKDAGQRAELLDLLDGADVLLHNMRASAIGRLGLGYEALRGRFPRLVYCAIVGYGQDGPYRDRPAYDDVIQAEAGWAELYARTGGEPRYAPTIVADKTTGLHAVAAINAALLARSVSGAGQAVEVPMFEVMASFLAVEHLAGRTFRPPLGDSGYSRVLSAHRRPYRTRDGHVCVMPYTATHWRAFFTAAGREDWAADAALGSDSARAAMIGALYERLAGCLPAETTGHWLALLRRLDIPCAPVNSIEDLMEDEHLRAVGFFQEVEHPSEGAVVNARAPVRFSGTPCAPARPAPPLER
ncbi:crotonobetainyl-CoA:carnitine CoA-transferase CaiB-like acyl-CoA transferase [Azospirillum agricola]|uniref:CaiB/BaiF CoA transferase family protein n=1 Tax=Azospirillum agricola TaxID=1720247 RepID=UPI001AEA6401|nr:CoA transferase [Azospirillum agricola]MBP2228920.1 crotonobetainyl-CoA:carnitine CoA-transferase CaiB-like acyl-CoA transferase [Azospirillum agricola]